MSAAAPTSLVWFRSDLRLADNPALHSAVERGGPVVCVYIWAPDEERPWPPGAASRWWLHHSLLRLDESLRRMGSRLLIRRGPTLNALASLVAETGASAIHWNGRHEPAVIERDRRLQAELQAAGVAVESFNGSALREPWELQTKQGRPYQVFTPFWRAVRAMPAPEPPLPAPPRIIAPSRWPTSTPLDELGLLPTIPWDAAFHDHWRPGEAGAHERLDSFLSSAVTGYHTERDRPDRDGTSRLSPHLHFGEISPRQIWQALGRRTSRGAETFRTELGWRDFAHHILYHFPHTTDAPLRRPFECFRWDSNPRLLRAWQRGRTGYPIVDAGLRQLWATGWMHNRVRMIVGSFLTKDLLISWQVGARWFWDTLVDADLANNTLGWQWVSGCGADAAPYFRIFNPVAQGEKFDPAGNYVRRWVPELAKLPARWIHQPWAAPATELDAADVRLGRDYPERIVDHTQARMRALAAFRTARDSPPMR